jgi:hypothetical protein
MFRSRHTARRGYADGSDSLYCFNFLTQRGSSRPHRPPKNASLRVRHLWTDNQL